MVNIQVDSLMFAFPESWKVSKYDDWAFYRNRFSQMYSGIKAVDLLAIENKIEDKVIWIIEVKDYRQSRRTKAIDLAEEVAQKVFSTLAAILPAKIHASESYEQRFAGEVLKGTQLRVVLHLEQPVKSSKLFQRAIDPSKVQQKLKTLIKPIDSHPKVVESTQMQNLAWTVT